MKNGAGGGEGISKFAVKFVACQKQKLLTLPLNICKNDLINPWLQHEPFGLEASSRKKIFCSLQSNFLPMQHPVNTVFVGPGIKF